MISFEYVPFLQLLYTLALSSLCVLVFMSVLVFLILFRLESLVPSDYSRFAHSEPLPVLGELDD